MIVNCGPIEHMYVYRLWEDLHYAGNRQRTWYLRSHIKRPVQSHRRNQRWHAVQRLDVLLGGEIFIWLPNRVLAATYLFVVVFCSDITWRFFTDHVNIPSPYCHAK